MTVSLTTEQRRDLQGYYDTGKLLWEQLEQLTHSIGELNDETGEEDFAIDLAFGDLGEARSLLDDALGVLRDKLAEGK